MNNMNDNRSKAGLVERYIGTAYDKVALVAENLDAILHAADHVLTHHSALFGRAEDNSHPQHAITGLVNDLQKINWVLTGIPSPEELAAIYVALDGKVDHGALESVKYELSNKANIADLLLKADKGEVQHVIDLLNGKADIALITTLEEEIVKRESIAVVDILREQVALKAEHSTVSGHINDQVIHFPKTDLIEQAEKDQPFGVASLDEHGMVDPNRVHAASVNAWYRTIDDFVTASPTLKTGMVVFIYGEGYAVGAPRVTSDKNGEYFLLMDGPFTKPEIEDPTSNGDKVFFRGDIIPSHNHAFSDLIDVAPFTLVGDFIAHIQANNPHNIEAIGIPLGTVITGITGTNVHSAFTSLAAVLKQQDTEIRNIATKVIAVQLLAEQNDLRILTTGALINSHVADMNNPHHLQYTDIEGAAPFALLNHSHDGMTGTEQYVKDHINDKASNIHGVSWNTLLDKPVLVDANHDHAGSYNRVFSGTTTPTTPPTGMLENDLFVEYI